MRGRTLANAAVILDEAQNTTSMQMKMFLTRLGENARMIVTGDPSQIDLPPGQKFRPRRGAAHSARRADGVVTVRFTDKDVVRHPLVAGIVAAYDATGPRRALVHAAITGCGDARIATRAAVEHGDYDGRPSPAGR